MIKASELVEKFKYAYTERWGYILNTAGVIWNQSDQDEAEREYNNAVKKGDQKLITRWENAAKYGSKWVGRKVTDCSGLFWWAFKQLGGYMYHGSNTMWSKYSVSKGDLKSGKRSDGKKLIPGTAVFRRNGYDYYHVGLYIGDSKVIEAQGTQVGVVISSINRWHAWAELKGVTYEQEVSPVSEIYLDAYVSAIGGVNFRAVPSVTGTRIENLPRGTVIKAMPGVKGW